MPLLATFFFLGQRADVAFATWIRALPCGHTERVRSPVEYLPLHYTSLAHHLHAHHFALAFLHIPSCTHFSALHFLHSRFCTSLRARTALHVTSSTLLHVTCCIPFSAKEFMHSLPCTSIQAPTSLHLSSAKCCFADSHCMPVFALSSVPRLLDM